MAIETDCVDLALFNIYSQNMQYHTYKSDDLKDINIHVIPI
jgi:hypothetical protein